MGGDGAGIARDGLFVYLGSGDQVKPLQGSDWLGYEPMGGSSKGVALNSLV